MFWLAFIFGMLKRPSTTEGHLSTPTKQGAIAMSTSAVRKVTVSLPSDLVSFADARAAERGATRSALIGELLQERRDRDREALAAEGYRYYAQESREFASASHRAVTEAIADDDAAW